MDHGSRIRLWPASVGVLAVVAPCACLGSLDYLGDTSAGTGTGTGTGTGAGASSASGPGAGGGGGATCEDVLEDEENCGECGHSCLGGACDEGRCQPVVVADEQDGPFGIGFDGTHVYWSNERSREIRRAAKTGGAHELVAVSTRGATLFVPTHLLVGPSLVVWVNTQAGTLLDGRALIAWPKDGGDPSGFAAPASDGNTGLAADGDTFWFANFGIGAVRVATLGQDYEELVEEQEGPAQVAIDATHVYWTNETAGGVRRADRDTGMPVESLDPRLDVASGIALDDDAVYVTSEARVLRIPKEGGEAVPLAESQFAPTGIVVADGRVYWLAGALQGVVRSIDTGGLEAEPTTLATGQSDPVLITADEQQLFWTNRGADPGTGSVMRLAR